VVVGRAVELPDPARRDQFRFEEELGRLPLTIAFERLTCLVPDLDSWRTAVEDKRVHMYVPEMKRLGKVLGPGTTHSSPVARSHLAKAIATAYLSALAEESDDVVTAYFASKSHPALP
jgi:hypothetical protein